MNTEAIAGGALLLLLVLCALGLWLRRRHRTKRPPAPPPIGELARKSTTRKSMLQPSKSYAKLDGDQELTAVSVTGGDGVSGGDGVQLYVGDVSGRSNEAPPPPHASSDEASCASAGPAPPPAQGFCLASIGASSALPPGLAPGTSFTPFALVHGKKPKKMARAFGHALAAYETTSCYGEEVPALLCFLWAGVKHADGLSTEGIFRLAGDPQICTAAEKSLAKGTLPKATPPEALAHLIKGFLRSLPGGLLGAVPSNLITECDSPAGCAALLAALGSRERALLSWLVRVTLEVAAREPQNKMDVRNVTLVLAPNLFGPPNPTANPMEELMLIKAATTTLHTLVTEAKKGSAPLGGGEAAAPQGDSARRSARIALLGAQPGSPPPPPSGAPSVGDGETGATHNHAARIDFA